MFNFLRQDRTGQWKMTTKTIRVKLFIRVIHSKLVQKNDHMRKKFALKDNHIIGEPAAFSCSAK